MTVKQLADLLRQAKDAHIAWETANGPDPDWPTWYAEYVVERLNAKELGR